MPRIQTYSSQATLQPNALGAERNTLLTINDAIGPEINAMADQVREADRKTFAQRASLDYIQRLDEIKNQVAQEHPDNPEQWSELIGQRAAPLIDGYTSGYVSQGNKLAVQEALNRQLISFQANAVEQAGKLSQQKRLVEFTDGINKLDNTIATAPAALARQLEAERMSMIEQNADLTPQARQESQQQYVINKALRTGDVSLLRTEGAGLPEEKRIQVQKQIEGEQRARMAEARQASFLEKASYEGLLLRDPEALTDDELNKNSALLPRDRAQIQLQRDRALQSIGALPEQQIELQNQLANNQFNANQSASVNALNYFYQTNAAAMDTNQKTALVAQTGVLPNQMTQEIVSQSINGDPAQKIEAAKLYNSIAVTRPDALNKIDQAAPEVRAIATQLKTLTEGGIPPQQAADEVTRAMQKPVTPEQLKAIDKDATKQAKAIARNLPSDMSTYLPFDKPQFPKGYQLLAEEQAKVAIANSIRIGGNGESAETAAKQRLQSFFGTTEVNKQKVLQPLPIERFTSIKEMPRLRATIKSSLAIPSDDFNVSVDPQTLADYAATGKPTYSVTFIDRKTGAIVPAPNRINADGEVIK